MVVEAHLHQRTCDKSLTGSVSGTHAHEICCTLLGVCLHFQAQMLFKSCTPYYSHPASHAMVDVQ